MLILPGKDVTLRTEHSVMLSTLILPENATSYDVTWISSDENKAYFDAKIKGKLIGKNPGDVTITVKAAAKNGKGEELTASIKVKVEAAVDSITLSSNPTAAAGVVPLAVNNTATITAAISPDNASNKQLNWTWTSSTDDAAEITIINNEIVAVKGLKSSYVTIKATAKDGFGAHASITVKIGDGGYYRGDEFRLRARYIFEIVTTANNWHDFYYGENRVALDELNGENQSNIYYALWQLPNDGDDYTAGDKDDGVRVAYRRYLDVHSRVKSTVESILNGIYPDGVLEDYEVGPATPWSKADALKFKYIKKTFVTKPFPYPIHEIGGYVPHEASHSLHNWGLAIDINGKQNGQYDGNGTKIHGGAYLPNFDIRSHTTNNAVVKAFKLYGWYWGGEWRDPTGKTTSAAAGQYYNKDYMHFSYILG
ncbi:MAG: Ig-like domain-containing protein [Oscillospiraceae bacterium]|nr:Ig-like domain-containing protein [Oscillospiraceae bacterium]